MRRLKLHRYFPASVGLILSALLLFGAMWLLLQTGPSVQAKSSQAVPADDGGQHGEHEIEGLLQDRPVATLLGDWEIQSERHVTVVVVADANTRFDWDEPRVGDFVKAKYIEQSDGTLLATRIRPTEFEAGEVVIRLADNVLPTTIADRYDLREAGALLASGHIYRFRTRGEDDDVKGLTGRLNADPDIVWAELNYVGGVLEGQPYKVWHWGGSDPSGYINQAAYDQVNLTPAWQHARGAGVIVAILDTGIDLNNAVFAGRVLDGWDMVDDDSVPLDEGAGLALGHGTHVAGIITYVAPESQLLPVRVLDPNGLGNTFTLAYAVEWAVEHGATVINLSLGAEADSRVLHAALDYAMAHGVVVVAAAGNNHTDQAQFPVAYPGVIGVTAVDADDQKADFANYSSIWVDLAAPGVGITSTIISDQGSGYAGWSGTSMSTAFVSGAAALIHQLAPTDSATTTLALLKRNGVNIDADNADFQGQVGRLLNIGEALNDLDPLATPTPTPTLSETTQPSPTPTVTPTPTAQDPPTPTPTPTATATQTAAEGDQTVRQYLPFVVR